MEGAGLFSRLRERPVSWLLSLVGVFSVVSTLRWINTTVLSNGEKARLALVIVTWIYYQQDGDPGVRCHSEIHKPNLLIIKYIPFSEWMRVDRPVSVGSSRF